ncbi:MAG: hypothetical protein ACI81O_001803 [Cyclobacteriaceae bacterium]
MALISRMNCRQLKLGDGRLLEDTPAGMNEGVS